MAVNNDNLGVFGCFCPTLDESWSHFAAGRCGVSLFIVTSPVDHFTDISLNPAGYFVCQALIF